MAILKAAATANDTLDSLSDTVIDGLILPTPSPGDYLLWTTIQVLTPGTSTSATFLFFNVYVGGVLVPHTERRFEQDGSLTDAAFTYVIGAIVSPNGSQDVEIRHRVSATDTPLVAQNRELTLFPSLNAAPIEVTATGDATTSSSMFAALLTATTPANGTYLCTFGTSGQGPSSNEAEYRVVVGGVVVAHSLRTQGPSNASVADRDECQGGLAVVVTPDGTEDVVIEWRRSSAPGTRTVHERTLTLTPTEPVDVKEASSVADDSDSTTSDVLIDGMTITDPGQEEYLVLFTGSDFYGTIGTGNAQTNYSIREGGVKVPDSDRRADHEESVDDVNMSVQAGGKVTIPNMTSDLEMFWQNTTTVTRTIHERTFVAIRLRPFLRPSHFVRQAFGTPRAHPAPYTFRAAPVPPTPPPVTLSGFMVVMGVEKFPRSRQQGWTTHAPRNGGLFSLTPSPGVSTGFLGVKFLQ